MKDKKYNVNVVISAAGMGTRLGMNIPKCLLEINNETLIARQLKQTYKCKSVYVVVGFKEELVIEEVLKYRRDAIIVRNPNYATTSNAYSLGLGSNFLKSFLALDGDVWFPDAEVKRMLLAIMTNIDNETILFSTIPKTEDCVFMLVNYIGKCVAFSRTDKTKAEWSGCGFYYGIHISPNAKYVFEEISQYLPLQTMQIECWEVDTPQDLDILKNLKLDD